LTRRGHNSITDIQLLGGCVLKDNKGAVEASMWALGEGEEKVLAKGEARNSVPPRISSKREGRKKKNILGSN